MDRANNPVGSRDDASTPPPIWPDVASTGNRLVLLAWAAAITELVFGLFCLFGFLTRFGAIGFVVTMLVAIWLTEIGPAVQTGATVLGFLPDRPPFDPGAWNVLLWQFALLMSALALLLLGPGRLSIDHLLFGGFAKGDDDDDD
ncbi:MAG: DoxX family protein [Phycisphaerales bacterium]|nr:MAG: DoxX family protein [Phycisphaerales bacterium]